MAGPAGELKGFFCGTLPRKRVVVFPFVQRFLVQHDECVRQTVRVVQDSFAGECVGYVSAPGTGGSRMGPAGREDVLGTC